MLTIDRKGWVTRRKFFERSAAALAAAGLLAGGVDATELAPDPEKKLDTASTQERRTSVFSISFPADASCLIKVELLTITS